MDWKEATRIGESMQHDTQEGARQDLLQATAFQDQDLQEVAVQNGELYAQWSRAAAIHLYGDSKPSTGCLLRGGMPVFKWMPLVPQWAMEVGRTPQTSAQADVVFWSSVSARLNDLKGNASQSHMAQLEIFFKVAHQTVNHHLPEQEHHTLGTLWRLRMADACQMTAGLLTICSTEAQTLADRCQKEHSYKATESFRQWIGTSMKDNQSALHKWTNEAGQLPAPATQMEVEGKVTADPQEVMEGRSTKWTKLWNMGPDGLDEIAKAVAKVWKMARSQDTQKVTLKQLDDALATFPNKTGLGIDQWAPKDLKNMNIDARLAFLGLI